MTTHPSATTLAQEIRAIRPRRRFTLAAAAIEREDVDGTATGKVRLRSRPPGDRASRFGEALLQSAGVDELDGTIERESAIEAGRAMLWLTRRKDWGLGKVRARRIEALGRAYIAVAKSIPA